MKKINKYVNKSIIENAFVNYEGYVGILNCLPTYFENINEISFDVALDRYLKLYFHQDIQFYKTRLGTVEHINNLKAIRNEIFKYGFYNITVLEIKKNWKLWYGKTNIYLIDSITSNKIKLNRVAAVLIESIDGRNLVWWLPLPSPEFDALRKMNPDIGFDIFDNVEWNYDERIFEMSHPLLTKKDIIEINEIIAAYAEVGYDLIIREKK